MYKYEIDDNGYVASIGETDQPTEYAITDERYEAVMNALENAPTPEPGYVLKLRTDLTWESELAPEPGPEEAGAEDYEDALERLGVEV